MPCVMCSVWCVWGGGEIAHRSLFLSPLYHLSFASPSVYPSSPPFHTLECMCSSPSTISLNSLHTRSSLLWSSPWSMSWRRVWFSQYSICEVVMMYVCVCRGGGGGGGQCYSHALILPIPFICIQFMNQSTCTTVGNRTHLDVQELDFARCLLPLPVPLTFTLERVQ